MSKGENVMGWNTGWAIMQEQVIGLYDLLGEGFTPEVCKVLLKVFADTDMDEGGKDYNMVSKDGKPEEQIIVETLLPQFDPLTYENEWMDYDDYETEDDKKYAAYCFRFGDLMRDSKFWSES
jgi:hypothetical protein